VKGYTRVFALTVLLTLAITAVSFVPAACVPTTPTLVTIATVSSPGSITTNAATGLVMTCNTPYGSPLNCAMIDGTGTSSDFSALKGLTRRPVVLECPANYGTFNPYVKYVAGNDLIGSYGVPPSNRFVYQVARDGSSVVPFVRMNSQPLSAMCWNFTSGWSKLLYVADENGYAYTISPNGGLKSVAVGGLGDHTPDVVAESINIFPTDATLGPLSGAICLLYGRRSGTGSPGLIATLTLKGTKPIVNTFDTSGLGELSYLGIVPAGKNLYLAASGVNVVYGISASDMAPYAGKLLGLVKQSGTQGLYQIGWDGAKFTANLIVATPGAYLEGACFTKAGIGGIAAAP